MGRESRRLLPGPHVGPCVDEPAAAPLKFEPLQPGAQREAQSHGETPRVDPGTVGHDERLRGGSAGAGFC